MSGWAAPPTATAPDLRTQRLSFLFTLFFGLSCYHCYQHSTTSEPASQKTVNVPRFITATEQANIPKFWESATTPIEHAERWGCHWQAVRNAFLKNSKLLDTPSKCFNWGQSEALQEVHKVNNSEHWDQILDPLVFERLLSALIL
jgi:hypothetical protein